MIAESVGCFRVTIWGAGNNWWMNIQFEENHKKTTIILESFCSKQDAVIRLGELRASLKKTSSKEAKRLIVMYRLGESRKYRLDEL